MRIRSSLDFMVVYYEAKQVCSVYFTYTVGYMYVISSLWMNDAPLCFLIDGVKERSVCGQNDLLTPAQRNLCLHALCLLVDFAAACVKHILSLYKKSANVPKSVVVVGHSMVNMSKCITSLES